MGTGKVNAGRVTLRASHPGGRGDRSTPSHFMLLKPEEAPACLQTLPYHLNPSIFKILVVVVVGPFEYTLQPIG